VKAARSASLLLDHGKPCVGSTASELRELRRDRAQDAERERQPAARQMGRYRPARTVRDYKARHASTMLTFAPWSTPSPESKPKPGSRLRRRVIRRHYAVYPPTGLAFGEPDDRLRRGTQYAGNLD